MTLTKPKYFIGTILLVMVIIYAIPDTYSKGERMMHLSTSNHVMVVPIPDDIELAGEKMPDKQSNQELLSREMQVNSFWHSNTIQLLQKSGRYFPIIEPILESEGVPNDFKYLAVIESGLQNLRSPIGAKGFWQLMPSTAKEFGLEVNSNVDERYHVEKSTRVACQYLKKAKNKFGNWTLAAAAFNRGIYGIEKELLRQKVKSYYDLLLNDETKRYVFRILAVKIIMSNPKKYGYIFEKSDLYELSPTKIINWDLPIQNIASFAEEQGINYKLLKIFNPWLIQNHLNNKSRKKYKIKIPLVRCD